MLLGKIYGKITTKDFKFLVTNETNKFEYIQVYHGAYGFVLCQVIELERNQDVLTASCNIIGYKDKEGKIHKLRIPFDPDSEVFRAEDELIKNIIKIDAEEKGAYIGKLEGRDIDVFVDIKKMLTKHVAILAKSGAGKSYTVGVLLEEIIDKKVPILIIDPHGEYSTMRFENTHPEEKERMALYGVKPKAFKIQEYGDMTLNKYVRPLMLSNKINQSELVEMLPGKLSSAQMGLLYSAMKHKDECDFDEILYELETEESNAKWSIINLIQQVQNTGIFSRTPTPYNELISSGKASIINLRGIAPDVQEIIVYKMCKDLFELRKQNKVPPFFLVIEESHNFCPERSFGEKKSSNILRTIASEGRKFGLGLAAISQRPARVDKSVISQCTTQIIMKVTNPNDLKAISNSVEGITLDTEKEIQNLAIGTCLITGVSEVPLFVNVRVRKSQHGGHAVDILGEQNNTNNINYYDLLENNNSNKHNNITNNSNKNYTNNNNNNNNNDKNNNISNNNESNTSYNNLNLNLSSREEPDVFQELKEYEEREIMPIIKPKTTKKDIGLMSEEKISEIRTILYPGYLFICYDKDGEYKLLVDMTTGDIVTDVENFTRKRLPHLETLSKKELKLLQTGFKFKVFSVNDVIKDIGTNLDLSDELLALVKKGYIVEVDNSTFKVSDRFIFNRLSNHKIFDDINYEETEYSEKKETMVNLDDVKNHLDKFTTIKDQSECFISVYEIFFERS